MSDDPANLTVRILVEIRDRLDQTNARLDQTNARLESGLRELREDLGAGLGQVNARLDQTNDRLDAVIDRLDRAETRLDRVETRLDLHGAALVKIVDGIGGLTARFDHFLTGPHGTHHRELDAANDDLRRDVSDLRTRVARLESRGPRRAPK